ncbi:sensor histidine kinase [Nocardia pseudovaccinii]|uniref:sensor histidine kinase n=1 Tax=Nocardia pseudovaccinii TaxID=189540 RepID=UPI0014712D3C|nr:nitrate- and nitrite sensing domain-containing protein [Nocardia pseudovaccinii]
MTARLGIRTRVLVIALIPSLTLFAIGAGTAGYLLRKQEQVKSWSSELEDANLQARDMIDAVQQERLLSLTALVQPRSNLPELNQARLHLDTALQALTSFETAIANTNIERMDSATRGFDALKMQLPDVRHRIDTGTMSVADAYGIYSGLLEGVAVGTELIGKSAPESRVAFEFAHETRVLRAMEAMSRSTALAGVVLSGSDLPDVLTAEFRNLVGYYRTELPQLANDLEGERGAKAKALISAPVWQELSTMEDYILHRSIDGRGVVSTPQATITAWQNNIDDAHTQLLGLWQAQNEYASRATSADAEQTSRDSLLAGSGVLSLALIAFLASLWLANRLSTRLRRLRTETLALAEEAFPTASHHLGQDIPDSIEVETGRLDFGHDEVGQVAEAFNQAHAAAIAAAVAEARTREGARAIFLNMAHRSQLVVHRQLEILDEAERQQEDPTLLDTFFKLDHLATRERRNAENLVVLAGGLAKRQWRQPVPLIELVRSAVSEALDYKRVRTSHMPQIHISGDAVADLAHLIAELVDNATQYSPPQSPVEVAGKVVGRGVAVEVNDQGIGMSAAELDRANQLLRQPPDFSVGAVSADLRLGLFVVAKLGVRHGISVRLTESDHGGVRAIVLIPTTLIAAESPLADQFMELEARPLQQNP